MNSSMVSSWASAGRPTRTGRSGLLPPASSERYLAFLGSSICSSAVALPPVYRTRGRRKQSSPRRPCDTAISPGGRKVAPVDKTARSRLCRQGRVRDTPSALLSGCPSADGIGSVPGRDACDLLEQLAAHSRGVVGIARATATNAPGPCSTFSRYSRISSSSEGLPWLEPTTMALTVAFSRAPASCTIFGEGPSLFLPSAEMSTVCSQQSGICARRPDATRRPVPSPVSVGWRRSQPRSRRPHCRRPPRWSEASSPRSAPSTRGSTIRKRPRPSVPPGRRGSRRARRAAATPQRGHRAAVDTPPRPPKTTRRARRRAPAGTSCPPRPRLRGRSRKCRRGPEAGSSPPAQIPPVPVARLAAKSPRRRDHRREDGAGGRSIAGSSTSFLPGAGGTIAAARLGSHSAFRRRVRMAARADDRSGRTASGRVVAGKISC